MTAEVIAIGSERRLGQIVDTDSAVGPWYFVFDGEPRAPVMAVAPSASYSLTVRLEIKNRPGMLGRVASAIGEAGGW